MTDTSFIIMSVSACSKTSLTCLTFHITPYPKNSWCCIDSFNVSTRTSDLVGALCSRRQWYFLPSALLSNHLWLLFFYFKMNTEGSSYKYMSWLFTILQKMHNMFFSLCIKPVLQFELLKTSIMFYPSFI